MSFGSDLELEEWLAARGFELPEGAPQLSVLRLKGSEYINSFYGPKFKGYPIGGVAQEDSWPRDGASVYGQIIPSDLIPQAVINASYEAAWYEANNPGKLMVVTTPGGQVKRRKVDVIEIEYFEGGASGAANATPVLSTVEGLLAPFLKPVHEPLVLVV